MASYVRSMIVYTVYVRLIEIDGCQNWTLFNFVIRQRLSEPPLRRVVQVNYGPAGL